MPKYVDMTGQRYGSLVALRVDRGRTKRGRTYWVFRCDCGSETSIARGLIRTGERDSCGCRTIHSGRFQEDHGMSYTAEHRAWTRMKRDCLNVNTPGYFRYGGRGINVCPEWVASFEAFYRHIGTRPSTRHSVDRIDCNGHYEPGNVRWATQKQQSLNRRASIRVTIDGKTKCVSEWCDELGVPRYRAYNRIRAGWSPEAAILRPPYG